MRKENWYSLRLGFTHQQAPQIASLGWEGFLEKSFQPSMLPLLPSFLEGSPASLQEYRQIKKGNEKSKKDFQVQERLRYVKMVQHWVNLMYISEYPLREKMVLFWSNHFVTSHQKIKITRLQWDLMQVFRKHAFGNIKELTLEVIRHPAMILYLDNHLNKKGSINENLSRELLELFTLGIGNYSEDDIREGARALAGLNMSESGSRYIEKWEDNENKVYLSQTGNWKAEDLIRIIFNHPKAARRFAEKLLRWFISDLPDDVMISLAEKKLLEYNFEMKPFLKFLFLAFPQEKYEGFMIKNPLSFLLETSNIFGVKKIPILALTRFLKPQGMELLNPPNVKGWDGGRSWLDAQKLLQRHELLRHFVSGKIWKVRKENEMEESELAPPEGISMDSSWKNTRDVVLGMADSWLIPSRESLLPIIENTPYDFKPDMEGRGLALNRLAENFLMLPEFQLC